MASEKNPSSPPAIGEQATDLRQRERHLIGELNRVRYQERSIEDQLMEIQGRELGLVHRPNGAAAAAILSSSLGVFALGLLTTLAAAFEEIGDWLNWYDPTGPLSGKTTLAGIIWLLAWPVSHYWLRSKEVRFDRFVQVSFVLIMLGLLLLFPPIFQRFE